MNSAISLGIKHRGSYVTSAFCASNDTRIDFMPTKTPLNSEYIEFIDDDIAVNTTKKFQVKYVSDSEVD